MMKACALGLRRKYQLFETISHQGRFKQSTLLDKFLDHRYSRLCRYEKPVGCMLLYWPTTWGLAIGAATVPCNFASK
jgi:hypothetical protein